MILVEVSLKIAIAHFVAGFKLAKIVCLFLNCVIGQMNKFVAQICEIKFSATSPDVTIFIKIAFESFIY